MTLQMPSAENPFEEYTPAALEDEVLYEVSSTKLKINGMEIWIYLDYAHKFLHRFFLYNHGEIKSKPNLPTAIFQIRTVDLKPELVETLEKLNSKELNTLMIRVVQRLLESVDNRYYHIAGSHGKIAWRFVRFICLN
jgi:hypothetical protein